MAEDTTGLDRLRRLAAYLPVVASGDFQVGSWVALDADIDGVRQLPYFVMSPEMDGFLATAYADGWVLPGFDWGAWSETSEATRLSSDSAFLASASVEQLEKLLTMLIRQERFAEGTLAAAHDSGWLARILRRADALVHEIRRP